MRRWVLLLMLSLLSVQSAWAAVGAYCQHQGDAVAKHFGHHEHRHDAATVGDDGGGGSTNPSSGNTGVDNDCGYCHLSGAQPLLTAVGVSAGRPPHAWSASISPHFSSHASEGLERPNWQALARSASLEEQLID